MKTIIKVSGWNDEQIFEKLSRKEMMNFVRDYEAYSGSSLYLRLDDGTFIAWDETEIPARRPFLTRIVAMIESNECSLQFYGDGKIVYNEETGFWDLQMQDL